MSKNPNAREIAILDFDQLIDFSAEQVVKIIRKTLAKQDKFTCALAGGKSPEVLYRALAKYKTDTIWNKVHVFSTDERFVPATHDFNNFAMIKRNLLSAVPIPEKNCHPMPVNAANAEAAAKEYDARLREFFKVNLGQYPRFDLVLLGMGEDGHTASLFPVVSKWLEQKKCVISLQHPKVEYERLSLTLPVLNNSAHAVFFIHGAKKADALYRIFRGKEELPSACVQPKDGELHFWLDREAGKKIYIL